MLIHQNDPYWNAVTLLIQPAANAGITSFVNAVDGALLTRTGEVVTVSSSPYAISSIAFDGTNDRLTAPGGTVNFGTGDFTMECWLYGAASNDQPIFRQNVTNGVICAIEPSTRRLRMGYNNVAWRITSTTALPTNAWTHVAVCRKGTTMRIYQNGVQVATGSNGDNFNQSATALDIGGAGGGADYNGYIADVRVTKFARYAAAFKPPIAPFSPY